MIEDAHNLYTVLLIVVEDAETNVALRLVSEFVQPLACGNHPSVHNLLNVVLVHVYPHRQGGAVVDRVALCGGVLVVVARGAIETHDLAVDLVQGGVTVVCIEDTEDQPTPVVVDTDDFEVEFPLACFEERSELVELVPVIVVVLLEGVLDQVTLVLPVERVFHLCQVCIFLLLVLI